MQRISKTTFYFDINHCLGRWRRKRCDTYPVLRRLLTYPVTGTLDVHAAFGERWLHAHAEATLQAVGRARVHGRAWRQQQPEKHTHSDDVSRYKITWTEVAGSLQNRLFKINLRHFINMHVRRSWDKTMVEWFRVRQVLTRDKQVVYLNLGGLKKELKNN